MSLSTELLSTLLTAAVQFSGLPAIDVSELPPVDVVSVEAFFKAVCPLKPGRCIAMVAAFDTQRYRILIRESLNMDDPAENSFLVHELVHVLQYKMDGSTRFMSCDAVLASEREAFETQNRYMNSLGLVRQEGIAVRYMKCPPPEKARDEAGTLH
jgi:hypothetical protein